MTAETPTASKTQQEMTVEEKISQLHKLFADAPEVGKTALKNVLSRLASDASKAPPPPVESAGRVGSRLGKVSELTIIVPFAPAGAKRLRSFLQLFGGNLAGADGWLGGRSRGVTAYMARVIRSLARGGGCVVRGVHDLTGPRTGQAREPPGCSLGGPREFPWGDAAVEIVASSLT